MKKLVAPRLITAVLAVVCLCIPATADACTACMGDPASKTAGAMNAAIFLMIGCVGLMLSSLGGFAFYLIKRGGAPLPPHAELDDSLNSSDDFK